LEVFFALSISAPPACCCSVLFLMMAAAGSTCAWHACVTEYVVEREGLGVHVRAGAWEVQA
jgi:hypothetical protein